MNSQDHIDRFHPVVLEDLLSHSQEWVNISDIVRLAFKAVQDVLKTQGALMKELEWQVSNKPSLNDLNKSLVPKVNTADVTRTFEQISKQLENRPTIQDLEAALEEKADKSEVALQFSSKVSVDQVRTMVDDRTSSLEFRRDLSSIQGKIDALTLEVSEMHKSSSTKREVDQLRESLDHLASRQQVDEQLELKASKQSVSTALHRKANKADMEEALSLKLDADLITQINLNVEAKLSSDEFHKHLLHMRETLVDKQELYSIQDKMALKTDKSITDSLSQELHQFKHDHKYAVESVQKKLESQIQSNNQSLNEINSNLNDLKENKDVEKLQFKLSEIDSQINSINSRHDHKISRYESLESKITSFATVEETREALKDIKTDFHSRIAVLREDLLQLDKQKAGVEATNQVLSLKADALLVQEVLERKASLEDLLLLRKRVEDLSLRKLETERFESHAQAVQHSLDELSREMVQKSNIRDVCKLLDLKANTAQLEKALGACKQDLSGKLELTRQEADRSQQGLILDVLTQENCLGRWVWKSGELRSNQGVPWELQATNTAPDNFLWEKDKSSILVVQPGLQEVQLGFQAHKKPQVQLLVNGEVVVNLVQQGHMHKTALAKPNKVIAGLTMFEILALPSKARVSVCQNCEETGEGFIGLKKL